MNKKTTSPNSGQKIKVRTWDPGSNAGGVNQIIYRHSMLKRHIYGKCKYLDARIAIFGAKQSAELLLEAIANTDIPIAGVYDIVKKPCIQGHPVRDIQELAQLKPEDVVIIASSAEATELYDTYMFIKSVCSSKVFHLKSFFDAYMLFEELKSPLQIQFDHFTFNRGLFTLPGECPYWHDLPPGVSFKNKVILELGPFEGNDTVMLMSKKPKKVISLEARPLNYAKISVLRSLHNWQNHELILGDMHLFPDLVKDKLDIIYCSGVLYHSDKPWWLLKSCLDRSDTIILCGHVASEFSKQPRRTREVKLESGTYQFEIYPEYGWGDGLSGITGQSLWFTEEDLVRFLDFYGFEFKKYDSHINSTGLWISSVVTRKKK